MTRDDANCFAICAAEAGLAVRDRYQQQAVDTPMIAAIDKFPTLRVGYRNVGAARCRTPPERWDANSLLRR